MEIINNKKYQLIESRKIVFRRFYRTMKHNWPVKIIHKTIVHGLILWGVIVGLALLSATLSIYLRTGKLIIVNSNTVPNTVYVVFVLLLILAVIFLIMIIMSSLLRIKRMVIHDNHFCLYNAFSSPLRFSSSSIIYFYTFPFRNFIIFRMKIEDKKNKDLNLSFVVESTTKNLDFLNALQQTTAREEDKNG